MTISGATARPPLAADDRGSGIERPARQQLVSVGWLAGLSLGLAVLAFAAGTPAPLLPFILAIGPMVIALVDRLARGRRRPPHAAPLADDPAGGSPLVPGPPDPHPLVARDRRRRRRPWASPWTGCWRRVFPAVLIVPIVVLVPAFTEELAWRGFALPQADVRDVAARRLPGARDPLDARARLPVRAGPVQRRPLGVADGGEHLLLLDPAHLDLHRHWWQRPHDRPVPCRAQRRRADHGAASRPRQRTRGSSGTSWRRSSRSPWSPSAACVADRRRRRAANARPDRPAPARVRWTCGQVEGVRAIPPPIARATASGVTPVGFEHHDRMHDAPHCAPTCASRCPENVELHGRRRRVPIGPASPARSAGPDDRLEAP